MELVLDSVYDGLVDEVVNLREIRKVFKERILSAKGTHNDLETQINKLDRDFKNKEHTLATDVKGLDMRMRLKENAWNTATNRAIEFNNVDQQISNYWAAEEISFQTLKKVSKERFCFPPKDRKGNLNISYE